MKYIIIIFLMISNIAFAGTRQLNVKRYLKYYSRYEKTIKLVSEKHGIDADIIKAVIAYESNWRATAIGGGNCVGLMQIKNGTTNPHRNIRNGSAMLARLYHKYKDWHKALSAYNRGEAGFRRLKVNSTKYSRNVIIYCNKIKLIDRVSSFNYYRIGLI